MGTKTVIVYLKSGGASVFLDAEKVEIGATENDYIRVEYTVQGKIPLNDLFKIADVSELKVSGVSIPLGGR